MFEVRFRRRLAWVLAVGVATSSFDVLAAHVGLAADAPAAAGVPSDDTAPLPDRSPPGKPGPADPAAVPHIEGGQVNGRWREGSRLIDKLGYFKLTGDRATFISSDGKLKFDGLENLAIERIARTIGDSPDPLEWSISGIITEYRGANYLLVTQAVLKTKATRARRAP
ncbi:MAG TPA: hypothetical protein VGY55_17600 [Pirellulales bacterium]|jgi:hypothetical protein|nr:hypothetical protein [Pirellulales bacterium]